MSEHLPVAARIADALPGRALPPVHLWNPPFCGDSGITITRDGGWLHQGTPITRPAMVRLFASVLRLDPDGYRLVTPVEKLAVTVVDLPFVATALVSEGAGDGRRLGFAINAADAVTAGPDHAVVATDAAGLPAVHVRAGLWARIARPVWYELCDLAIEAEGAQPGLWSDGCFFALDTAA